MKFRIAAPAVALAVSLFTAGCSQPSERIAAGTHHCTEVRLAPDLTMRLSSYGEEQERWVAQACHPTGTACTVVLSYDHAPPPIYTISGHTVDVELLGGVLHRRLDEAKTSRTFNFRTHVVTENIGTAGIRSFYSKIQHVCPPPNRQYPQ